MTFLLDASVWIASMDPRDPHTGDSQRLIGSVSSGATLAALDLTLYEVANVAVRRWRAPEHARTLVSLIRESCPKLIASIDEALAISTISHADEHGLSVYDAAYVAAARQHGWTLVSTDHADLVSPGHAITPQDAIAR